MSTQILEGRLCTKEGTPFGPQCDDDEEAEELLDFIQRKFARNPTRVTDQDLCQALQDLRKINAPRKYQTLTESLAEMEEHDLEIREAREALDKLAAEASKKWRKFEVKKPMVLGFITDNEQQDILIEDGIIRLFENRDVCRLSLDEKTVYKSTTTSSVIEAGLANGSLEEI